jgi:hypothetical protein
VAEWEAEFGGHAPEGMGSLMRQVVDERLLAKMSANQRAAAAWYRANGDRERKHTTGVFLKRPRVKGAAPVMGVYVDSHAMATDFGVNKGIYLARLANVGCEVSGIEFLPSRTPRKKSAAATMPQAPQRPAQLPQLSPIERAEVDELVSELPEGLRAAASKAIELSKRREKQNTTSEGPTP